MSLSSDVADTISTPLGERDHHRVNGAARYKEHFQQHMLSRASMRPPGYKHYIKPNKQEYDTLAQAVSNASTLSGPIL